nr:ABC transporter permease [Amycolatopsis nigrescens]
MLSTGRETVLVTEDGAGTGRALGVFDLPGVVSALRPSAVAPDRAVVPGESGPPEPLEALPDPAPSPVPQVAARRRPRWRGLLVRPVLLALVLLVLYLVVGSRPIDSIEQRYLNGQEIKAELFDHIGLSLLSTLFTIVIAVPLGILFTRPSARWIRPVGLGLGNLGQAIPSIGLVVLLALWVGTGFGTALAALVVYATLPVLRNTIVGIEGIDPTVTDAARGMGMSRLAVLARIELPLAVPVILAGIRTALVLTIASATLATFIGGGGLGGGLVAGVGLYRPTLSLTFGILVAVLALFADWLGLLAEEVLRPRGI